MRNKPTKKPAVRKPVIDRIKDFLAHPVTLAVCKVLIGSLFIISSISKIPDTARFADSIVNYKILPDFLIMPLAVIVPWIQLIAGILIILDIYAQSSAFILCGLLVVYIAAITSAYVRGIDIECGCFDFLSQWGLEDRVGITAIIRDLVFLVFPGIVLLFDKNGFNLYGFFRLFKK